MIDYVEEQCTGACFGELHLLSSVFDAQTNI